MADVEKSASMTMKQQQKIFFKDDKILSVSLKIGFQTGPFQSPVVYSPEPKQGLHEMTFGDYMISGQGHYQGMLEHRVCSNVNP